MTEYINKYIDLIINTPGADIWKKEQCPLICNAVLESVVKLWDNKITNYDKRSELEDFNHPDEEEK